MEPQKDPHKKSHLLTQAYVYLSLSLYYFFFQRMWYSTLSKSRASPPESIPSHLLCSRHIFNRRLWRFRPRHMAVTTVHGDNDLCCLDRVANAIRTVGIHVDGKAKVGWLVLITQSSIGKTRRRLQYNTARGYYNGFS